MAEIKNLEKAAQRIKEAVKNKENIIIFGDADLDGVSSVILVEETLKTLGGKAAEVYFPNREEEGYGLNGDALESFSKYSPGILILVDSGMSSFVAIEKARKLGFETIIVDHHQPLEKLPPASIIVNPQQPGDNYPFKLLAACGVTFKLVKELLGERISKNIEENFLELVALGTIADLMPKVEDNLFFIERGVSSLPKTCRPGLKVFPELFPLDNFSLASLAQKMISLFQLTDFKDHLTESYLALTCPEEKEAKKWVSLLFEKNKARGELLRSLLEEIEDKITGNPSSFILQGSGEIPHLLTGNLASKLCNKFKKPVFIYAVKNGVIRGSVRTPKTIDSVAALSYCRSLLSIYGGHPQAAGFTVKIENLEKFKQCLENYFQK